MKPETDPYPTGINPVAVAEYFKKNPDAARSFLREHAPALATAAISSLLPDIPVEQKQTLYDLAPEHLGILSQVAEIEAEVAEAGGELTPALEEKYDAVFKSLLEIEGKVGDKFDGYGALIRFFDESRARAGHHIQRLRERAQPLLDEAQIYLDEAKRKEELLDKVTAIIERMKQRALDYMRMMSYKKVTGREFVFEMKGKGGSRAVDDIDHEHLPDELVRETITMKFNRGDLSEKELKVISWLKENSTDKLDDDGKVIREGIVRKVEVEPDKKAIGKYMSDRKSEVLVLIGEGPDAKLETKIPEEFGTSDVPMRIIAKLAPKKADLQIY